MIFNRCTWHRLDWIRGREREIENVPTIHTIYFIWFEMWIVNCECAFARKMIQTVHGNVYGDGAVKIRCRIMPLIWIDLWEYEQNISMVSLRTALFVPTFLIFCVLSSCDLCIRCGARVRALLCICICVCESMCLCWLVGRSVGWLLRFAFAYYILVACSAGCCLNAV